MFASWLVTHQMFEGDMAANLTCTHKTRTWTFASVEHSSGLYYKHITISSDNSRVVWMTLQVVASPIIIILMTLEAPTIVILTNLKNIHSIVVTYDHHLRLSKYFYSTGHNLSTQKRKLRSIKVL